jgi:hypothetical protein
MISLSKCLLSGVVTVALLVQKLFIFVKVQGSLLCIKLRVSVTRSA